MRCSACWRCWSAPIDSAPRGHDTSDTHHSRQIKGRKTVSVSDGTGRHHISLSQEEKRIQQNISLILIHHGDPAISLLHHRTATRSTSSCWLQLSNVAVRSLALTRPSHSTADPLDCRRDALATPSRPYPLAARHDMRFPFLVRDPCVMTHRSVIATQETPIRD